MQAGAPCGWVPTRGSDGGRSKPRGPPSSPAPALHLCEGETEAQKGQMSHPRSHAREWQGRDSNPGVCRSSTLHCDKTLPPNATCPFLTLERARFDGRDQGLPLRPALPGGGYQHLKRASPFIKDSTGSSSIPGPSDLQLQNLKPIRLS